MEGNNIIDIKLIAQDLAQATIKAVKSELQSVETQAKSTATSLTSLSTKFETASSKLNGIGIALGLAFGTFSLGIKQAIGASTNYEKALTSLGIIAERFGISQDMAKQEAESLGKTLRIGVGASAEALQNLFQAGLNLPMATDLLKRFTNEAMTGKSANISLAEAVQNLSFAYMTENSTLGNMSGVSQNFNDIIERGAKQMGIKVDAMNDAQRAEAKYRGMIDVTNLTLGSAQKFTGSLIDTQAELEQQTTSLKVAIGEGLAPTINTMLKAITPVVKGIAEFAKENPKLITTIVGLTGALLGGGLALIGIIKISAGVITAVNAIGTAMSTMGIAVTLTNPVLLTFVAILGLLGASLLASSYMEDEASKSNNKLGGSVKGATDAINGQGEAFKSLATNATDTSKEVAKAMQAIADENYSFNKSLADIQDRRKKDYDDSIRDLTKETALFQQNQEDMLKEYQKSVEQMEADHKDKVEKVKSDLEDENKQFDASMTDRQKKYSQDTERIKDENTSRLKNIELMFNRTLKKGSDTYNQDLKNYKDAIAKEEIAGDLKLKDLEDQYNEEIKTDKEKHDKKLLQLNQELEKENKQFEDDFKTKKERFDRETKAEKDAYAERSAELNKKIAEDKAVLEKHANDFKQINRGMILDEVDELKKGHLQKLKDLNENLAQQKGSVLGFTDQINKALGNIKPLDIGNLLTIDWGALANKVVEGFKGLVKILAVGLTSIFLEGLRIFTNAIINLPVVGDAFKKMGINEQFMTQQTAGLQAGLLKTFGIKANAKGTDNFSGGLTLINEEGGEIVDLPNGTRIIPHDVSTEMARSGKAGGGQFIQNNYFNNTQVNPNLIASRFNSMLRTL